MYKDSLNRRYSSITSPPSLGYIYVKALCRNLSCASSGSARLFTAAEGFALTQSRTSLSPGFLSVSSWYTITAARLGATQRDAELLLDLNRRPFQRDDTAVFGE